MLAAWCNQSDMHVLKYGPVPNFWNEYVFLSYHHFQRDVVFLAGLPDVKGSLPHGDLARKRR